jgi:hypothetical protein
MHRIACLLFGVAIAGCQFETATDTALGELAGDPIAACPVPAPGAIAGHEADFYLCAEETAACGPDGYLVGYGAKYAQRFYRYTRPWMSRAGKQWIDDVLVCLQETLRDRIDAGTSCADIQTIAYDSHPDCYVEAGFCSLPWSDWLAVVATVDGADWLSRDAQRQVTVTARTCLTRW